MKKYVEDHCSICNGSLFIEPSIDGPGVDVVCDSCGKKYYSPTFDEIKADKDDEKFHSRHNGD